MKHIRLKTNLTNKAIQDRLQYDPEIIELHLEAADLNAPSRLLEVIRLFKERGIKVFLHHPAKINGKFLDILSSDPEVQSYYWQSSRILADICQEEKIRCVIHAHYSGTESSTHVSAHQTRRMKDKIDEILSFGQGIFLWEDTIEGLFSYSNPYLIEDLIAPLKLPLNIDVSHAFISLRGDNHKLKHVLERTAPFVRYFHLVDSLGIGHDSLPLGQGAIDWEMVIPYTENHDFIFEIGLSGDHTDCRLMVESAAYYTNLLQQVTQKSN
ncbi:TIM barrel protein [Paenibacillus alkalitolerans]|uniref:TIM barrel protein n=1 Tax=Paenibacillus alkalitolerans TaxID=2799335 RepID=UPI0018F6A11A|nr:TIM barrel protein [Paenibacillus alkalitolerans]